MVQEHVKMRNMYENILENKIKYMPRDKILFIFM